MELRVLNYFLVVAQEENITRAAALLHVTQPTLSRQLAELEAELGVKLFYRGSRRITLTEQGMLLRRRAEEVTSLVQRIEREVRQADGPLTGVIAIGSAETAATRLLPAFMKEFSGRYPQVSYELFTGNADTVRERIDKGLLDIGLLTEPVEVSRYEFLRLNEKDRWGVLTRADSPLAQKPAVAMKDLEGQPLLLPHRREVQQTLVEFGLDRQTMRVFGTYDLIGSAMQMVSCGLCHALALECALTQYDLSSVCFRPLVPQQCTTSVLVWKRHQPSTEAVRRFIEEMTRFAARK